MTLSRRELRARKGRNGRPAWQRHMKVLLAELNQLKDEQQALKYCLMSTGVLTQGDLARLAPRRCRAPPSAERRESRAAALCRAPHVVRTLAQLVGSDALHFAAASRAASSACRSVMLMSEVSPGQGGQGLFGRLFSTASISRGASQASQGAPAQENETTPASSEEADVPRMRLSARLFSRLLSWKNSEEENSNVSDVMQLKEVLRGFGWAAGATAAFQLSESCRGCNEALRPILPLISQEAPYIYVSGGSCGLVVDSAERLNPRTGLWETLPSMCIPRRACATASTGGRFYVLGGVDVPRFVGSFDLPSWAYEDKYRPECFDPAQNRWELLPAMNRPYTHAAATALGGYIYVFGGLSFGHVLDQAQRFAHGQWECLDPMPTPRFECTAAATKGRIYVLGGSNISGEALGCVECYEPSSGLWRQLPEMRQARYGSAVAALKGRVYVFGGHSHWENLSDCECYDAELERWFPLPAMAAPRSHCGAAAAGGRIYVFGGHTNGQDIMTIDCLDPETLSWEVEPLQMPRPRSHCMTATVQS